ncbi:hypothetical protein O181_011767 [Austropuccinia psidii MF-1]|uniref:Uncharacterized protein n=1 Tax=Austropuccinia psidii MF-1 TaxID=1389203 RepID=A0A9Q3BWC1_9BASI|nr:hypothetical protein [Austropuccinia psidii MF-1]
MPLAQSMLDQSEMRNQRNKDFKAFNVPKHASQKEKQRCLKAELHDNFHGMGSAVHAHCLFLLKVKDKDFSSVLAPPSTEEGDIAIQVSGHLESVFQNILNEPSTQVQSQDFQSFYENVLNQLGMGELGATSFEQADDHGVVT